MRLLITGGAGFIGSNLADKALEAGWKVAVLDDLSSGRRENVPEAAEFFQVDIQDVAAVENAFASFKPTAVSHQAAQASVAVSVREPQKDASINIVGSINVMQAGIDHKVGHLVFASTGGAIYGEVPEGTRASALQFDTVLTTRNKTKSWLGSLRWYNFAMSEIAIPALCQPRCG